MNLENRIKQKENFIKDLSKYAKVPVEIICETIETYERFFDVSDILCAFIKYKNYAFKHLSDWIAEMRIERE